MGLFESIGSAVSGVVNTGISSLSSGYQAATKIVSSVIYGSGSTTTKTAETTTKSSGSSGTKSAGADYSGKQVSVSSQATVVALDAGELGVATPYVSKVTVKNVSAGADYAGTQIKSTVLDAGTTIKTTPKSITTYAPWGEYSQIEIKTTKIAIDPTTEEIGIYQLKPGRSGSAEWDWSLVSSGGRAAVQSGMYTVVYPETPVVYTQYNQTPALAASANATEAAKVLANPEKYSRLGAEAYGGYVLPLDSRTVESTGAQLSTYANPYNLANLVNPQGVNLSKSAAPGANVPWAISGSAPVISSMGPGGLGGELILPALVTTTTIKTPFISTVDIEKINAQLTKTTTEPAFGIMGLTLAAQGATEKTPSALDTGGDLNATLNEYRAQHGNNFVLTGGLLGKLAFGEQAPEVITGAIASGVDVITGLVGWTPGKDYMSKTDTSLTTFRTQKSALEQKMSELENYGVSTFGVTSEGKIKIDESNAQAMKFYEEYQATTTEYENLISSAKETGTLKFTSKGYVENPALTNEYGEFSKWSRGAGAYVRQSLGFSEAQLEAYGATLERKQGIGTIPEKIVYGVGYTLSTDPGQFISGYIGGAGFILGGEVLGGVAEGIGITSRLAAIGTAHPTAAAITSGAIRYGLPTAFAGLTYYGASEGFTATPERTTINLGKMTPELAGMIYGGASVYVGLRAVDTGHIGFVSKEKNVAFEGIFPETEKVTAEGVLKNLGFSEIQIRNIKTTEARRLEGFGEIEPYAIINREGSIGGTRVPVSDILLEKPKTIIEPEDFAINLEKAGASLWEPGRNYPSLLGQKTIYDVIEPKGLTEGETASFQSDIVGTWPKYPEALPRFEISAESIPFTIEKPLTSEEAAFGLSLKIEPAGISMPSGISSAARQALVNPEILSGTRIASGYSVETEIMQNLKLGEVARAKEYKGISDIIGGVESIKPKEISLGTGEFETALKAAAEATEKRGGVSKISRMPTGISTDLLRESFKGRPAVLEPQKLAEKQLSPTRSDLDNYIGNTKDYRSLNDHLRQMKLYQEDRLAELSVGVYGQGELGISKSAASMVLSGSMMSPANINDALSSELGATRSISNAIAMSERAAQRQDIGSIQDQAQQTRQVQMIDYAPPPAYPKVIETEPPVRDVEVTPYAEPLKPFVPTTITPWSPTEIIPTEPLITEKTPQIGAIISLPSFGENAGGGYGLRGKRTWVNVHPVGADIVKKSQGSMPDFRKFRMKKFPKF